MLLSVAASRPAAGRVAGHHPPLDRDRLLALHAHRRRPPPHRRARHRRPRARHRQQQPPRRSAGPRARGRRPRGDVHRARRQARPHRAPPRDRDAHDRPARLPLLRHLRLRRRGRRPESRWPSTTSAARRLPTRVPTGLRDYPLTRKVLAGADDRRWSTSTTRTPTRPRSPSCAARATAACSWCRSIVPGRHRSASSRSSTRSAPAQYSRQELRLAEAIAGQAAVAITTPSSSPSGGAATKTWTACVP